MRVGFWKQFDWILAISAVLLSFFGIVSMISSTTTSEQLFSSIVLYQLSFLVVSVAACYLIAVVEYRSLQSFATILYSVALVVLVLVLIFGEERNGSKSWFNLGIISVQPAEFAKLMFILMLAWFFSRSTNHSTRTILHSLALLIPVTVLVFLEPDVGTMLVFIAIWFIMTLGLNLSRKQRFLFVGISVTLVTCVAVTAFLVLPPDNFQIRRMQVYPDHLLVKNIFHTEIGYQVDQSMIAIGAGGISGKGLGQGSQSQFGFLPARTTDFIFASITEEIGFIGATILITLLLTILLRILQTARLARDLFGKYVCIGIFGMILYHTFQNIGMNSGLLPVTGIPLSFVSYGGSHLLTVYLALGLVESISLRSKNAL